VTESQNATIIIKPKRDKPIINQHPWVFSGAIRGIEGNPQPGDIVTVRAHDRAFLGKGYWNPTSQIRVRMLTWEDESIDDAWWSKMLQRAITHRGNPFRQHDAINLGYRLINAENDYLPGLVIDRYGDWVVLQALTLGIDTRKTTIAELLTKLLPNIRGVYERSDVDIRELEGLESSTGLLWGEAPPEAIEIEEDTHMMLVDVYNGHKTGHYLDQSVSRDRFNQLLNTEFTHTTKPHILNLFSYTGAFSHVASATGNASVTNVDASLDALELAERIANFNGFSEADTNYIQANVFEYLRDIADEGAQYDVVILDPPKFAHNKHQIDRASRGYKDINLNALNVIKPGGFLLTFSCSGAISSELFQKIVFGALVDSGRQAQIIDYLGHSPDHPVALTFPEGHYLKGLLLRVY